MSPSTYNLRDRMALTLGRSTHSQLLLAVCAAAAFGLLAGAVATFLPVWAGFVVLLALAAAVFFFFSTDYALAAVLGLAAVLPFGTLPFKALVTPSFLELALIGLMAFWLLRLLTDPNATLILTPLGLPLIGFLGLTMFSFLLGSNMSPDSLTLHNYFKFLLGITFFFSVVNCIRTRTQARWMLRGLMLAGAFSALIGLVLYVLPNSLSEQILVQFGRIGYPNTGRVLRFIMDDTSGIERAIGLSVDPNSYGGMLSLVGAIVATQIVAERPILPRWLLIGMASLIALLVLLTYSRAALAGLLVAAGYVATLRYRRLWWAMLAAAVLLSLVLLGLGVGQDFITRIVEGVQFRDQANQMRLAEYRNAIAVIQAYPVFGIGFGAAPEIDLVAGVSSIYLAIGQRTGLLGLAAFLGLMVFFFAQSLGALGAAGLAGDDERAAWLVSLQAGVAAALSVGVLDHYFFNIEFSHMATLLWGVIGLATVLKDDQEQGIPDHLKI